MDGRRTKVGSARVFLQALLGALWLASSLACEQPHRRERADGAIATEKPPRGDGGGTADVPLAAPDGRASAADGATPEGDPGCPPGHHFCDTTCVDGRSPLTCGRACDPCPGVAGGEATCDGFRCGVSCPAGKKPCLDACIDEGLPCSGGCPAGKNLCNEVCVDAKNVAACGTSCTACPSSPNGTTTCDGDQCSLTCKPGHHRCGDRCVRDDDVGTCGTSCAPCPAPSGGTASCDGTTCGAVCPTGTKLCFGACIANDKACDGKCPAGKRACGGNCVADNDVNFCGEACKPCSPPANAVATCSGGACVFTCRSGFHDCGNGVVVCKDDSSNTSCGSSCSACPVPVNGRASCDGKACGFACDQGFRKCNGKCQQCCTPADCGSPSQNWLCNAGTCQPAKVDCQVSAWSAFGPCSKACGGGTRTRTRAVTVPPQNGGAACPALMDSEACNPQPCPVDCQVSAFGAWGACSKSCGGGTRTRSRTVTTPASNGGKACPALSETEACNTQPCPAPVDCQVSAWSAFGACSAACGGGTRTRTRTVTVAPQNGGQACPALSESEACNTQPCSMCPPGKILCPNGCSDLRTDTRNCGECGNTCASMRVCNQGACVPPGGSPP